MARMEEEEQEPLATIGATAAAPRERLSDGLPRRSPPCSCASPYSPPSTSCCRRRTATPSPRASSPPALSSTSPLPAPLSPSASSATKPATSSSPPAMARSIKLGCMLVVDASAVFHRHAAAPSDTALPRDDRPRCCSAGTEPALHDAMEVF